MTNDHAGRDLAVARFAGIDGAERAFADARDRDPGAAWTGDAAFVEVHRDGRIVVRGNVAGHYVDSDGARDAMGRETGIGIGTVAGAAGGFLLGPLTFAVGVVGGAIVGGIDEARERSEPQGPVFDAIRVQVPEGSSAVVVIADHERVGAMADALAGAAETLERNRLSPVAETDLRSALAEAPPSTTA